MGVRHSPGKSPMQVSKSESCEREFLSKEFSSQTTEQMSDGNYVDEPLLHKLELYFHHHCRLLLEQEMCKDDCTKFDAVISELPTAPDCTGKSGTHKMCTNVEDSEKESIADFPCFRKNSLKSGSDVALLWEHYMIMPWMSSFTNAGFLVIPYPYAFDFGNNTVPNWHTQAFQRRFASLQW